MQKLLIKSALMVCLLLLTYVTLFFLPPKSQLVYTSIIDKHERLKAAGSPKIVFIGGSNLALGLDSAVVHNRTGLPVINMGLNGALGLRYMLEEVKPDIGPGDLIVLSPEYEHWYGSLLDGGLNLLWIMQIRPDFAQFISSPQQYGTLIKNLPEFMQAKFLEVLPARPDPIYNRSAFNEFGDFVNHLNLPAPQQLAGIARLKEEKFNDQTLATIGAFGKFADERGATVVYLFPSLAETQFTFQDNQAAIAQIYQKLQALSTITVIGTPDDYVFPDPMFFDTVYHLRADGRQLRSEKISTMLLSTVLHDPQKVVNSAP